MGFSDDSISKFLIMDYTAYSPIAEWFVERKETKQRRLELFKHRRLFRFNVEHYGKWMKEQVQKWRK